MNCHAARESLPELLDRRTPATAHLEARAHLAGCAGCQREFAALAQTLDTLDAMPTPPPSARLRQNFYAMLAEERGAVRPVRPVRHDAVAMHSAWWRAWLAPLAGAALAAGGFLAGARFGAPVPVNPQGTGTETAALRRIDELEQKLNTMGRLVAASSLLQQQQRPANDRLRGVLTSATSASEHPDEQVINELIGTLALDPSVNIRLRALDGLFPHADQEVVRAGVLASLPRESSPLVQVSMIDFLAAAHDVEARPALEKLALTQGADRSVREAARRALTQF